VSREVVGCAMTIESGATRILPYLNDFGSNILCLLEIVKVKQFRD